MAKLVSNVYGDALYEVATENNCLDKMLEECEAIKVALEDNPDFIDVMNHPKVTSEEKEKLLTDTFDGKISNEIVGLMDMILKKGHFSEIISVLDYFIDMAHEAKGIGKASVTSAVELSEQQKKAVESRLVETTKYNSFIVNYGVDESLIGGLVIRIGDRVVDSSIKSTLSDMTRELMNVRLTV